MARRGLPPGIASSAGRVGLSSWRIRAAGAVHGLLLGGFTLPAKLQGALAFRSAPISGARSLSFATPVPRLPIFWVLLQKMGPKFDIIPELLGGFRGEDFVPNISDLGKRIHRRALLAVFACKTAQKFRRAHCGRLAPLRSPNPPACFATASAQAPVAGEGAFASFRPVGARAVLSARVPRAGFFRPASPFLAQLYPFESAVCRVVVFVRVCRSMPWLVHPARPSSWLL